jgi:hypothetical protein
MILARKWPSAKIEVLLPKHFTKGHRWLSLNALAKPRNRNLRPSLSDQDTIKRDDFQLQTLGLNLHPPLRWLWSVVSMCRCQTRLGSLLRTRRVDRQERRFGDAALTAIHSDQV